MKTLSKIIGLLLSTTYSMSGLAQAPQNGFDSTSTTQLDELYEPAPTYTSAQIIPAYKIGLKKGMFEFSSGLGHSDISKDALNGQSNYIKTRPQTDYVPMQMAYAFTDNLYLSIASKAIQERDRETRSNFEGMKEPQFTGSYMFRTTNSGFQITGTYTPDMGPQERTANGISRVEGNAYNGGSSTEVQLGYFLRWESLIFGGEASYLYKDTRTINQDTLVLGQKVNPTQTRVQGGAEKTIRGTLELAAPFRFGGFIGRTWIELEESMVVYQPAPTFINSHYKNFFGGYARFQVLPRFSIVPILSYSEKPDTSGLSSGREQETTTQINLRYRF